MGRKFFCIAIALALFQLSYGQLQPGPYLGKSEVNTRQWQNHSRTTTCATDTVIYARAKGTGLIGLTTNINSSAGKVGQWFDAPQELTIHGFTFFAWQSNMTNDTVTLTCNVYLADADSLPTGVVLGSATVEVDTTFGGGVLSVIEKKVKFPNPITTDLPYVISVENNTSISVAVVTTHWDSTDGQGEWLSSAYILGSGWLHGYEINVGGVPFDADFAFEPWISYDLNADFTLDTNCILNGGTVNFTNTSMSPVLDSRVYNQYAYLGNDSLTHVWNYGDGSAPRFVFEGAHTFAAGTDFQVELRNSLVGWTTTCEETKTFIINKTTDSEFSFTRSGFQVDFTDATAGAEHWLWEFGDGDTSQQQNPSHTYNSYGVYTVCLTTGDTCLTDMECKTVTICDTLVNDFNYNANGLIVSFSAQVVGTDTLQWDFGDGSTSMTPNPSHLYGSGGTYTVCLIAKNQCVADTFCRQITVSPVNSGIGGVGQSGSVSVFPNPSNDIFNIALSAISGEAEIAVYNILGERILSKTVNEQQALVKVDLSKNPAGTYWLMITNDREIYFKEIALLRR